MMHGQKNIKLIGLFLYSGLHTQTFSPTSFAAPLLPDRCPY